MQYYEPCAVCRRTTRVLPESGLPGMVCYLCRGWRPLPDTVRSQMSTEATPRGLEHRAVFVDEAEGYKHGDIVQIAPAAAYEGLLPEGQRVTGVDVVGGMRTTVAAVRRGEHIYIEDIKQEPVPAEVKFAVPHGANLEQVLEAIRDAQSRELQPCPVCPASIGGRCEAHRGPHVELSKAPTEVALHYNDKGLKRTDVRPIERGEYKPMSIGYVDVHIEVNDSSPWRTLLDNDAFEVLWNPDDKQLMIDFHGAGDDSILLEADAIPGPDELQELADTLDRLRAVLEQERKP